MGNYILDAGLLAMLCLAVQGTFTAGSLCNFLTLASGWLLCRSRRTTTKLILAAGALGVKNFACYHRFFSQAAWGVRSFWTGILLMVAERLCPTGELILVGDDTVLGKSGKKISGAANWRNACGSTRQQFRFLWGLNWVILGLAIDFCGKTFCLPINLRLYRKEEDCRKRGKPYHTRSELMRQMVEEVLEAIPLRSLVLLVDGQYATRKLMADLSSRITLITRLRRDAAIYLPVKKRKGQQKGRPRKRGHRLPTPEVISTKSRWPWQTTPEGREAKTLVVLWYSVLKSHPARLIIVKQKNPREPYAYFLCSNPSWVPDRILSTYTRRWSIEITIRDAKQQAGLADAQCRRPLAVERQSAFILGMMTLLVTWYIHEGHQKDVRNVFPWYRHKQGPTFNDMLAHGRRRSLLQRFSATSVLEGDLIKNPGGFIDYLRAVA